MISTAFSNREKIVPMLFELCFRALGSYFKGNNNW